ncbi:MAG: S8 family serine peptidase, partial [Lachnospiraceae bacterium]|nr:S8 family serine peptidase [Lachnospiraceae bacterium]
MKKRNISRFLAMFMSLCLVLGLFASVKTTSAKAEETGAPEASVVLEGKDGAASVLEFEAVNEESGLDAELRNQDEAVEDAAPQFADDDEVRVMIVMKDDAAIDAGYELDSIAENDEAIAYTEQLEQAQDEVVEQIEDEVLDGEELNTRYSFTLLTNAVSADVAFGKVADIEALDEVEAVYVVPRYELMSNENSDDPDTISAGDMVGSYSTWLSGYTGAGMRVAVIDTGLDTSHPSFAEDAYLYGLEETAKKNNKTVADYDLLDKEEIEAALPLLKANAMTGGRLTADYVYGSAKTPFTFNYVDVNLNVTHKYDKEGDHGTHVAGITTANKYVNNNGSFEKQEAGVVGVAPDAQLFVMKVFGEGGGAYTDDYMAAIEDAVVLGADAVNLSLGSSSAGESVEFAAADQYINEIMDKVAQTNTVVSISAGNAYSWSNFEINGYGHNFTDDVNDNTVGSPGSYRNAFTVASANNYGFTGNYAVFGDRNVFYDEGGSGKNKPMTSLAGKELEFVLIEGLGSEEDYEGRDVTGKIVLVQRGQFNFANKHMNAQAAGAIGCFIYNNVSGNMGMSLEGSSATIPCVSISLEDALAIKEEATFDEATGVYTGKVSISQKVATNYNVPDGYTMSDFSSWGALGDLTLKPEITAPGGNIYSTLDNGTYGVNSGTSMAAPSITGLSALVIQYIEENDLAAKTGLSSRVLAQSLLMSTAVPLVEADGEEYSPRKQGAGLVNAQLATTTPTYILVGDKEGNDGKVKAELLDDPARKGEYSFDFTVYNLNPKKRAYYTFDSTTLTEDVLYGVFTANSSHELKPQVTFKTNSEAYMYDIDHNGWIDILDVRYILAYANGGYKASLIDSCIEFFDFNENGIIDTNDARLFFLGIRNPKKSKIDFYKKAFAVKDKAKVTVTIKLSADDRAYLEENFANGMFVDGFVYLNGKIDLSIPFLAFYGN